jgi:hypothetical protein
VGDLPHRPRDTPLSASGGRSVGIVRWRTKGHGVFFLLEEHLHEGDRFSQLIFVSTVVKSGVNSSDILLNGISE